MTPSFTWFLAFLIGFFSGLRSLTPAAVVAWSAHLRHFRLRPPLGLIGSIPALAILTLGALAELVADKLPNAPNRTDPLGLTARLAFGGLTGACIAAAAHQSTYTGAFLGAFGGLVGCFGGFQIRTKVVKALRVHVVAVIEDLVTVGGALWVVSRF